MSWKSTSEQEDIYTQARLHSILQKYGSINALIISSKRRGSAIVEFANKKDADLAYAVERGLPTCPLSFSWIKDDRPEEVTEMSRPAPPTPAASSSLADFEARVLQSMREAQERKRRMESNGST